LKLTGQTRKIANKIHKFTRQSPTSTQKGNTHNCTRRNHLHAAARLELARLQNVGIGRRRDRYRWSGENLASSITDLLDNPAPNDKLPASSDAMKKAAGITGGSRSNSRPDPKGTATCRTGFISTANG
jgi:hypothetical protein